jgi:ABC-type bacteriocin/lantibiotic exporter with double-glycine peptidase domain
VVAIYASAVGLLTLASPIAVQALVGTVAFGTLLQPIVILSLILLAALTFQAVLRGLQSWVVERLQQRTFVRAALDLAWRLPRVRLDEGQHGFGATTLNRFFEVPIIQKSLGVLLTDGVAYVLQLTIGMLVLAFYHPFLLAFDLALMAVVALVVWVPLRRGVDTGIAESYAKHDVAAWLQQLAVPSALFRGRGAATFALERAELLTRRYVHERRRHFRVLFSQKLGVLAIQVAASAALLGLGGLLVLRGELTLGQLVAAEIIVAAVAGAVARFGKLLDAVYDLLASLDKLGSVLDVELERPEAEEPIPGREPVRVELRLEGEHPWKLAVGSGERVAIVGARGHVIGEWLTALRVPDRGVVTFNNVEGHRAGLALRDSVALVRARDSFPGTILENVSVCRPGTTAADVRAALDKVGLLEEVRLLPRGLDTELFADGAPLDTSQRARLALARAVLNAPRLLVVDGVVDGLSPEERQVVINTLTRPGAPWTLVALVDDPQSPLARACTRTVTLPDFHHPRASPPPWCAPRARCASCRVCWAQPARCWCSPSPSRGSRASTAPGGWWPSPPSSASRRWTRPSRAA